MPVTVSYPGIYIEELPNSAHTITAAATSIAVFVGYTHPFKTNNFNKAVRLFSFTDYEREFGGFFSSGLVDANVAYAVNEFFLNGGSDCYVVGLQARYMGMSNNVLGGSGALAPPKATIATTGGGLEFTGKQPTDGLLKMHINLGNPRASVSSALDTADITIVYGPSVETFRGVTLTGTPDTNKNHLQNRINNASSLVSVAPSPLYGTAFIAAVTDLPANSQAPPIGFATTFSALDFTKVFEANSDLDKVSIFNLMAIPGVSDVSILSAALAFCEHKQAFFIMDPPAQTPADLTTTGIDSYINNTAPKSANGALYFPYVKTSDALTGQPKNLPPSGYVAGIFARTDTNRGVWKAPAGLETTLLDTTGVVDSGRMTDPMQGALNLDGVNCLRTFPGVGTVVYGARTLVSSNVAYQQWKYVPVRRMALFIEQTLLRNLGWVVFEPNDTPLWVAIRTSIENFMLSLFQQGALQGTTPSQAFQVKCDASTTTSDDQVNGIVNIIVAFAPLKPAEFVVVKIAQMAGQAQS